jgi:hypothetical protein
VSQPAGRDAPRSIEELGLSVDLPAEPWRYPGPFLPFSCLQTDTLLAAWADHDIAGRHLVIAIGSNASPDVMRRKFSRNRVSTDIPHIVGTLRGFALGHSAHVSFAGYVAATVFPDQMSTIDIVVSALTDEQLDCLDRTEPNYRRLSVCATHLELSVPLALPDRVFLYQSWRGVVIDAPFGTQADIFERLRAWELLPAELAEITDTTRLTRELAGNPEWREAITAALAARSQPYAMPDCCG